MKIHTTALPGKFLEKPRTVYISNKARNQNYKAAEEFGSVVFVTQGKFPIFKTNLLRGEIIKVLLWSEEDDYLLLSGSTVVAGLCLMIWLMLHKQCKLLLHDPKMGYIPRKFSREEVMMEVETLRDKME